MGDQAMVSHKLFSDQPPESIYKRLQLVKQSSRSNRGGGPEMPTFSRSSSVSFEGRIKDQVSLPHQLARSRHVPK